MSLPHTYYIYRTDCGAYRLYHVRPGQQDVCVAEYAWGRYAGYQLSADIVREFLAEVERREAAGG